jgi:hypothetical protein
VKKKIWANFKRIKELFTQKIVNKLSKIWVWDPGSGKNLFRIPDPGIKKAPDPESGPATLLKPKNGFIVVIQQSIKRIFLILPYSLIIILMGDPAQHSF